MTNKHYLVTGGTGFLGAALVRGLVAQGHRVRIIDNNSRGALRRLGDVLNDVEMIEADIRDSQAVADASVGVDAICHLAFVNGTQFFYEKLVSRGGGGAGHVHHVASSRALMLLSFLERYSFYCSS